MGEVLDFNLVPPLKPFEWQYDQGLSLDDIKQCLSERAIHFVGDFLSNAYIKGNHAYVGDINNTPGKSLVIVVKGHKAGTWNDFGDHSCSGSGNLFELYMRLKSISDTKEGRAQAIEEVTDWLGLKSQSVPKGSPPPEQTHLGAPSHTWFYKDREGRIIATISRYDLDKIDSNGKRVKEFRPYHAITGKYEMPDPRPIYNIPGVLSADEVVITEGEKAADAIIAAGLTATTLMGGINARLDKSDLTPLAGKKIILWPDVGAGADKWCQSYKSALEPLGCSVRAIVSPSAMEGWDAADASHEEIMKLVGSFAKPKGFKLLKAGDLKSALPPDFILEGFLLEKGFASVVGSPGSGKSFVVMDQVLCIAHGIPWHGRVTQKRCVAYIAGEGASGMGQRIAAWDTKHALDSDDVDFYLLPSAVNLVDDKTDLKNLFECLDCVNPDVIVVDTLARSFAGGDENSAKDMGQFVDTCGALQTRYKSAVIVIHHLGKDVDKGGRGSSALKGGLDSEFIVKKTEGMPNIKLITAKQKDVEEARVVPLRLQSIEITHPVSGEVKTSCVVMEDEGIFGNRRQKLSDKQRAIIEVFEDGEEYTVSQISDVLGLNKKTVETIIKNLHEWSHIKEIPSTYPKKYTIETWG